MILPLSVWLDGEATRMEKTKRGKKDRAEGKQE